MCYSLSAYHISLPEDFLEISNSWRREEIAYPFSHFSHSHLFLLCLWGQDLNPPWKVSEIWDSLLASSSSSSAVKWTPQTIALLLWNLSHIFVFLLTFASLALIHFDSDSFRGLLAVNMSLILTFTMLLTWPSQMKILPCLLIVKLFTTLQVAPPHL